MSVDYLNSYLHLAEVMPSDIQPEFTGLRQADQDTAPMLQEVDACLAVLKDAQESADGRMDALTKLQAALQRLSEVQERKTKMAERIQGVVSKHSAVMAKAEKEYKDGTYLKIAAEVQQARAAASAPKRSAEAAAGSSQQASKSARTSNASASGRVKSAESGKAKSVPSTSSKPGSKKSSSSSSSASSKAAKSTKASKEDGKSKAKADSEGRSTKKKSKSKAKEADKPKEQVYCIRGCNLTVGDMVACDNDNCKGGEWFHYACVGLQKAPTAKKWYCMTCKPKFSRGRGR